MGGGALVAPCFWVLFVFLGLLFFVVGIVKWALSAKAAYDRRRWLPYRVMGASEGGRCSTQRP